MQAISSISNNTKIYFGKDINAMFVDFIQSLMLKESPRKDFKFDAEIPLQEERIEDKPELKIDAKPKSKQ